MECVRVGTAIVLAGWLVALGGAVAQTGLTGDCVDTGEGEVWTTAVEQNTLKIVTGPGCVATLSHPSLLQPHGVEFSLSGQFAYVSNLGNGNLVVVRAEDRQVVATFNLGPNRLHHAKPSPDGSVLLATHLDSRKVFRISADEATQTWTVMDSLTLKDAGGNLRSPVCVAFRSDGRRAYVSLNPQDIAVVDISPGTPLTQTTAFRTIGSVQCGMVNSKDGKTMFVDSNGGGGHFYRLDTTTDVLTEDLSYTIGAVDLQDFDVSPNEKWAFAADRGFNRLKVLDLKGSGVEEILLEPRPGFLDKPDMVAVAGNNIYVTMRTAGVLAWVKARQRTVTFIDLGIAPSGLPHGNGIAIRP
jgi:DNA-binding beta-propeller fold protein YncE